ncbi:MAG: hypothetical protein EBS06_00280 [Proteobacteria bacterium]|nr:hypothetical protein [Pseudomonadota bacterium]
MPLRKNQANLLSNKVKNFIFTFIFLISRAFALFYSFPCITDVPSYLEWSKKLQSNLIPYIQFNFEYPPLALIPIYWSGIFSNAELTSYYIAFAFFMFSADFFCLKICQNYCKNRLAMNKEQVCYMTLLYSLFGLLLFRILYHRLDIVVALFFVTSLFFFQTKNSKVTPQFFINGLLGFFYKIVPAFIMPSAFIIKAFIAAESTKDSKQIIKKIFLNSLLFAVSLAAITWTLEIYTNHRFIDNMLYHQKRGIQIESSYGSFLLIKNLLISSSHSEIYSAFGSYNVLGNNSFEFSAKFFGNLILCCFYSALFFIFLFKKNLGKKIKFSEKQFLEVTLITILLLISFQRILSPQFFIWLIPISAMWLAQNRYLKFLVIFSFLFFSTFFLFSVDYISLIDESPIMVTTLFLRNCVLIIFTIWLTINFLKNLKNAAH